MIDATRRKMASAAGTISIFQLDAQKVQEYLDRDDVTRKQLQAWAKELKIPANGTTEHLKAEIGAKIRDKSGIQSWGGGLLNTMFHDGRPAIEDLENATVAGLKDFCKVRGTAQGRHTRSC